MNLRENWTLKDRRILLVDDDPDQAFLVDALNRDGLLPSPMGDEPRGIGGIRAVLHIVLPYFLVERLPNCIQFADENELLFLCKEE